MLLKQSLKIVAAVCCWVLAGASVAQLTKIEPGAIWPDDRGKHIQAHGGGITKVGNTFYWFGEDRPQDLDRNVRAIACYASEDLMNWRYRGRVFAMSNRPLPDDYPGKDKIHPRPPNLMREGLVIERPKVYHNKSTGKFVMYFHLDSGDYWAAEVGVAVSDTVDGDYKLVSHFRPFGKESRDIGMFLDDDGSAYLIFEDRKVGFHIASLTDDYLNVKEIVHTWNARIEGGALVKYDGMYYVIGSYLTGWDPNDNQYATAPSIKGPWTPFKDVAPKGARTYGSQSSFALKIEGSETTTVILMADIWRPWAQHDSRYLWMPLEIGGGKAFLPQPRPWSIDVKTGRVTIDQNAPAMVLPPPPPREERRRPATRPATQPSTQPAAN